MADPVAANYEAAYFVEYEVEDPDPADDVDEIARRVKLDTEFRDTVLQMPAIGNPFFAQQNHFNYQEEPPEIWRWSNTLERDREYIMKSLLNRATVSMMQKARLHEYIGDIEGTKERMRVLKDCNYQLVYVWYILDAFKSLDERIFKIRDEVDDAWSIDPDLNEHVRRGERLAKVA